MNKNPYTMPAMCLAGVLLVAVALSGCRPAQAYEQASTAKIETAAMPSQKASTESSDAGDEKEYPLTEESDLTEEEFTLAMVPEYSGNAYADINDDIPFFSEDELTAETFQEYWPLDELGRCSGAFACIGPESLPTEPRENISMIEPTGWHSVQ